MQFDSFTLFLGLGALFILLICYAIFGFITESIRSVHQKFAEEDKKKREEGQKKSAA